MRRLGIERRRGGRATKRIAWHGIGIEHNLSALLGAALELNRIEVHWRGGDAECFDPMGMDRQGE